MIEVQPLASQFQFCLDKKGTLIAVLLDLQFHKLVKSTSALYVSLHTFHFKPEVLGGRGGTLCQKFLNEHVSKLSIDDFQYYGFKIQVKG